MSIAGVASSSNIQLDYMKLLVTELRNQNPLEPMDNNQMASQLSQFSQLQQLESMNTNFADLLNASKLNYANSLLGKKVSYYEVDALSGEAEMRLSAVDEVFADIDGESFLLVDRYALGLEDISNSLIGQQISYFQEDEYGRLQVKAGIINNFHSNAEEGNFMLIDGQKVALDDVVLNSLLGTKVSFQTTNELTGAVENKSSTINDVYFADGNDIFVVGQYLRLQDVISVKG
jgi:flagellar basal-body rod modification protein FlgD